MGLANLGLQAATTVIYAYTTDVSLGGSVLANLNANTATVLQAAERRDLLLDQLR